MKRPVIGYAGMTHLGLNSSATTAERGFETVCFDPDERLIERLASSELPVSEPGLPGMLQNNAHRLRFTSKPENLTECDVVYVAADVPTDKTGRSDLGPIDELIDIASPMLRSGAPMVFLSQVPPGFTRCRIRDFPLYYQVETLIFGRAIERALHPERFILGCAEPAQPLPAAFHTFLESFGCPILRMRYESAELAKISINLCLIASVSVANTLAELCESTGADWAEIVPALRLDKRIGEHAYLTPGLGIAGGNLERDLATVRFLADRHGTDAGIVTAAQNNSRYRRDWALRTLYREILSRMEDPVIAVLGLAYKQDTTSTKNSPAIALIEHLHLFQIRVFDPAVSSSIIDSPRCHPARSELDACEGADALVVMTPWPQFGLLDPASIARKLRGRTVLDPYAVLNRSAWQASGFQYMTLGVQH